MESRRWLVLALSLLTGCATVSPLRLGDPQQAPPPQPAAPQQALAPLGRAYHLLAGPGPLAPPALTRLSVPGRAIASSGTYSYAVDGNPSSYWYPSAPPQWISVPLQHAAVGPMLVAWHATGILYLNNTTAPRSYKVMVSSNSTDGRNGTWTTVMSVTDNPVRSRADAVSAPGATWLRLYFSNWWTAGPKLRELEVYESKSTTNFDSWLILGDSITMYAFDPQYPDNLPATVNSLLPPYWPVLIPGGTGGDTAGNGQQKLTTALPLCPPGSFIGLAYGTNDARLAVPISTFKSQLQDMISRSKAAGHLPVLARTPYSPRYPSISKYVAAIDDLCTANNLPAGPDLYNWFLAHPDELGTDQIHPTSTGIQSIQRLWAQTVATVYTQ